VVPEELLSIYLKDHLAGSTGGVALAKRLAGENSGNDYGRELERIAREIEEDQQELRRLMDRRGVSPSRFKQAGAWLGEHVSRVKMNGVLRGYSPLSRVLELEGLAMGVTGKLELWRSLKSAHGPALEGIDLNRLEERAVAQRKALEELHARAAREALRGSDGASPPEG
jgi:hypothetical protein